MKKHIFIIIILYLISFYQICFSQIQRCATPDASQVINGNALYKISSNISIPVIFHVVYASNGNGNVSDSQLQEQINVMNNSYSGTRYSFYLFGITRTQNDSWHNSSRLSQSETNMTNSLAVDPQHRFMKLDII